MADHTPEPWECGDPETGRRLWPATYIHAAGVNGRHVGSTGGYSDSHEANTLEINAANARRIVAAVNALKDIPTEWLEREDSHLYLNAAYDAVKEAVND